MKRIVNILGGAIVKFSFLRAFLHSLNGNNFRIIYYHIVSDEMPDYYFKNKGVSFNDFKAQIKYFKQHYKFITIGEALSKAEKGESLKGYLCVTTDDGFAENHSLIAPYLKQNDIRATLFLIDKCIDNKHLMWRNKLIYIQNTLGKEKVYSLMLSFTKENDLPSPLAKDDVMSWSKREFSMPLKEELTNKFWEHCKMEPIGDFLQKYKPYMSTDQINELIEQGFEIGAHSLSHAFSDKMEYAQLEEETIGSIENLQNKFNVKISSFSYPFGPRAKQKDENTLIEKHSETLKALIGIKNRLKNTSSNPLNWERDLQEANLKAAAFRFYILPLFRKIRS